MEWVKKITGKFCFDHWWQTETGWPITSMCPGLMTNEELLQVPSGVSGKVFDNFFFKLYHLNLLHKCYLTSKAVPGYDSKKRML